MRRENFIAGWMAAAVLAMAAVVTSPSLAQRTNFRPAPQFIQNRPQPHPGGHAGDWLRKYQGLPPGEQERALQNDPGFRRMSPAQQQHLRPWLHYFASLPPREQQRIVGNMDRWASIPTESCAIWC